MNLSFLKDEKLPESVIRSIEEGFASYTGEIELLNHTVRPTLSGRNICHSLYLCIRGRDGRLSYVVSVDWIENDYNIKHDSYYVSVNALSVYDFPIFKKLLPELSEV